jgi:ribulose-5-phosphate 4-epimerase/fuculose-1-phosphate aldolase
MDIVLLPATDLGPHIPWFEEPRLVTTDDLGRQLNTALGEAAAVLMRWHGITVVGDTVDQMFERAMFLEENARVVYEASTMGRVIPVPSKGFEYMNENREGRRPGARTFNYFANLERGGGGGQIHEGRSSRER